MNRTQKFALGALSAVIAISLLKKKNNATWDTLTNQRIQTLHPALRPKATAFINAAYNRGIPLRITEGYRTLTQQEKDYAQGRTKTGAIITNAKPGESLHNYALAFDVVPVVNGTINYNTSRWDEIGAIGKSFGFTWGGNFKSILDKPHFEMTFGNTLAMLKDKYSKGKVQDGYILLS